MKGFLGKIFNLRGTRQAPREKIKEVHNILYFINDTSFRLSDISKIGLALIDENRYQFSEGKKYSGYLEVFNGDKCLVDIKVIRLRNGIIGCEVVENASFISFLEKFMKNSYYGNQA